jgi:Uma2 family endonuclease
MDEKISDWLDARTLAVILVDPRRRVVKVHRSPTDVVVLNEADTLAVEDIVPGWQMRVGEIFE